MSKGMSKPTYYLQVSHTDHRSDPAKRNFTGRAEIWAHRGSDDPTCSRLGWEASPSAAEDAALASLQMVLEWWRDWYTGAALLVMEHRAKLKAKAEQTKGPHGPQEQA